MSGIRLLKIDAGGSGWRAAWANGSRVSSSSIKAPPPIVAGQLNPEKLAEGVNQLWHQIRDRDPSTPTVVAVSSTGVARLPSPLDRMHESLVLWDTVEETLIVSDVAAGLGGALDSLGNGALLSVGTGVAGVARSPAGEWTFRDGWGPLIGDEGGGYWIGCEGLRAALRQMDGRAKGSEVLFGLASQVFDEDPTRWPLRGDLEEAVSRVASFAPYVCQAAGGDEVSAEIVDRACRHLVATADSLGATTVHVGGGMLESQWFRQQLLARASRPHLVPANGGPIAGLGLIETFGSKAFATWFGPLGSWRNHM